MTELKALGSGKTVYKYNFPDRKLLETFPSPFSENISGSLHIECPEFTSLCPKTGQPDFAKIVIDYWPNKLCVESKSLKLYLMGFRMFGEFHEGCVNRICRDLAELLKPIRLIVRGEFAPRGGIPFWPTAVYEEDSNA